MGRMNGDPEDPERQPEEQPPENAATPDEPAAPAREPVEDPASYGPAEPLIEAAHEEELHDEPLYEAAPDEATPPHVEPDAYEPPPQPRYVAPPPEPAAPRYQPPPPRYEAPTPPPRRDPPPMEEGLFGDADIPMPPPTRRVDRQRARDARVNLDLDLGRIKRRKRYGLVITTISVLFIAFVLLPVTWVGAYLFFDPPATILMVQRAAEGQSISHTAIPINRMSPHIVRAVIAAEDANFCTHDGFDIEAIQDAMESNARGGRTRGASTISQQVAKNLFLWPERSWLRKGLETYFTALIEFMWPKRRIMQAYLNAAEWGDGNFGIEAAARARFGVAAADLTPLQAARLAAVLPSPNRWRADSPGPYVRRRAASIVERARVVRNERMAACAVIMDRPAPTP
jgi:monofunctional biosynthetic peptidoglycan transglycosylase